MPPGRRPVHVPQDRCPRPFPGAATGTSRRYILYGSTRVAIFSIGLEAGPGRACSEAAATRRTTFLVSERERVGGPIGPPHMSFTGRARRSYGLSVWNTAGLEEPSMGSGSLLGAGGHSN